MDYTNKTIRDIYIIKRDEEDIIKHKGKGGSSPIYVCKCLLCGKIFKRKIYNILNNKFGNCGCKSLQYDFTNQKFGKLLAIKPNGVNKKGQILWECLCDCGNYCIKTSYSLRVGYGIQCDMCKRKMISQKNSKPKKYSKRLYECYVNMKTRATNKNQDHNNRYINRGVKMCDEWLNDYYAFEKWALENGYNENLTLDRIDNNGNYEPNNCRWATAKEQANNRRTNRLLEYNNEFNTMANWSNILGIKYCNIQRMIKKGKTLSEIVIYYDKKH